MGYEANARKEYYKMFDIIMNMMTPRRTAQLVQSLTLITTKLINF